MELFSNGLGSRLNCRVACIPRYPGPFPPEREGHSTTSQPPTEPPTQRSGPPTTAPGEHSVVETTGKPSSPGTIWLTYGFVLQAVVQ